MTESATYVRIASKRSSLPALDAGRLERKRKAGWVKWLVQRNVRRHLRQPIHPAISARELHRQISSIPRCEIRLLLE